MKKRAVFSAFVFILVILFSMNLVFAGELKVTLEHPFYVNGEWTSASELNVGDMLTTFDGKKVVIKEIDDVVLELPIYVYNFEDAFFHNYIVGREKVIVHNSGKVEPILNHPKAKEALNILEQYGYGDFKADYSRFLLDLEKRGLRYEDIKFGGTGMGTMETVTTNIDTKIPVKILYEHPELDYFFAAEHPKLLKTFPINGQKECSPFSQIYEVITNFFKK